MRFAFSIFLVCTSVPAVAQSRPELSGDWIDSQANRFQLSEIGDYVKITASGWSFDAGAVTYSANLSLSGPRTGNEFTAEQRSQDGAWFVSGRLAANGSILGRMQPPGRKPFEFILERSKRPTDQPAAGMPERIVLMPAKQSTATGRWIPVSVALQDRNGRIVSPAGDVFVYLKAQGGTAIPSRVRITPGAPRAPAGIRVMPGNVALRAESADLKPAAIIAWGCADTPVTGIQISSRRSDAVANGRDPLPVTLQFVDADGSPTNNQGRAKSVAWTVDGAVRKILPDRSGFASDIAVAPDECVSQQEFTSDRPGKATAVAAFANLREQVSFRFHAPLTAVAFLLALAGGLLGGAVSATTKHKAALRWKAKRWGVWMLSALTGALALFLAWHYGFVNQWSAVPSGSGFALLAGMIGGFAGSRVLAGFVDTVVPEKKADQARASGAA